LALAPRSLRTSLAEGLIRLSSRTILASGFYQSYQLGRQIAYGDFGLGADVDLLACDLVGLRYAGETVGDVPAEVEVARWGGVAELDLGGSREKLRYDGRNDRARRLARAVSVEGPDYRYRQREGAEEGLRQTVGADLRGAVGGLPLEGMLFVDGDVLRGAVDLRSGGCEKLGRPHVAARPGGRSKSP
jgi:hypothetical protein